jgi:hypothetical protein
MALEKLRPRAFETRLRATQSRTHQISHRLMRLIGNPHRRQFARSQQTCQGQRIPSIGLYPIARPTRDQRRRHHHACVPEGQDLAIQPIARWTGLVTEMQRLVTVG